MGTYYYLKCISVQHYLFLYLSNYVDFLETGIQYLNINKSDDLNFESNETNSRKQYTHPFHFHPSHKRMNIMYIFSSAVSTFVSNNDSVVSNLVSQRCVGTLVSDMTTPNCWEWKTRDILNFSKFNILVAYHKNVEWLSALRYSIFECIATKNVGVFFYGLEVIAT